MNWKEIFMGLFLGIKEVLKFAKENHNSVNIEATVNELEGKIYAIEGHTDSLQKELSEAKIMIVNMERKKNDAEEKAVVQEMRADRAEQKIKELEKEIDGLNKFFKE